tara:strand:- start:691 stop:999 length:309 start_codon:yes stop_codon:yes gene_type:complete
MRNKNWIEFNNQNIKNENITIKFGPTKSKNIKIHKEKKGKKGKTITIVTGFRSENRLHLAELLKNLKIYCGTGGTLIDKGIQLQGDMSLKVVEFLRKEGYEI